VIVTGFKLGWDPIQARDGWPKGKRKSWNREFLYLAISGNYQRSGENRGYEMDSGSFQRLDKSRIIADKAPLASRSIQMVCTVGKPPIAYLSFPNDPPL
jgi:hypothetical protein